jgi:hypothetical protein
MRTYNDLMEVMAMADMNKIKGGTEEQRKIAQERQRRREAKNAEQDKLAVRTKEAQSDPLSKAAPDVKALPAPTKASAQSDPLSKAAPNVKAPPTPTKASAQSDPLSKAAPKALPPADKGVQLVKQKQQKAAPIQKAPKPQTNKIQKAPKPPVEKVKVKVEPPKNQPVKDERQAPGRRRVPDKTYPAIDNATKKPKKKGINFGKLAKKGLSGVGNVAKKGVGGALGTAGKLKNRAIDQNKNQRRVGSSKADDVEQSELRMYGDERF